MEEEALSLTERLAGHLLRPVAAEDRARARRHLLDWLASVAGAGRTPEAAVARAEPDLLTRAALRGNVLEMDDVDRAARLHPGPVVWPAALSAARETGASMGALLDAAVAGYEAMIRVGRALDTHHYAHWHPTATAGGFGAAAASARLFGLEARRTVWALGHAGSLAGGLWQVRHEPEAMTKAVHVTQAALAGLWHARLARAGAPGPRFILEGPQGLFAAMTEAPDGEALAAPMAGWRIAETSLKPWPACRHAHPTIDAALALPAGALAEGPIAVATYGDALRFCDRPHPATAAEARFSLQHAVAVVAVRGRPGLSDFEPGALADPALVAARARVVVGADVAIARRYPAHYGARVSAGGLSRQVDDAWGDPERPLGDADLVAKVTALAQWGRLDGAGEAVALVLHGDDGAPVAPLFALLERWVA
jgi:2-methylcitrate dehydratase PrpD